MSFFSSITGAINDFIGDENLSMAPFGVGQSYVAGQNLKLSKEQFGYQKWLQQEMFNREDTAHQRAVTDLKAAGFSPMLAVGAKANAGPVVPTTTPRRDITSGIDISTIMNMMKMKADISLSEEQRNLIRAQTEKTYTDKDLSTIKGYQSAHDYKITKKTGTTSNAGAIGKALRDVFGIVKSSPDMFDSLVRDMGSKLRKIDPAMKNRKYREFQKSQSDMYRRIYQKYKNK